ncbi:MAG: hypothetical protein FJ109_17155 [Deltaproteobacteria bacterium]|nr:hypothetical protein [Deltaproteobacteria bacterium]
MRHLALCMGLGLLMLACSGGGDYYEESGEPKWVVRGSGAFEEGGKKIFFGVGMVNGIGNKALARSTAENRARADLGKIFRTYSASLMRDYMASTTAGDMTASAEEQHVDQAIKTFSKITLSGVMIVDHWQDPSDGTVYALARLDLAEFGGALEKMKELDAKTRDFVRANADKAFYRLAAEEQK